MINLARSSAANHLRAMRKSLVALLAKSDRTMPKPGSNGERMSREQSRNVAEIDRLTDSVMQSSDSGVSGILRAAKTQAMRACRSQVRKLRLARSKRNDTPGGEG